MVTHRITLIEGDGIGNEVVTAARRAVEATGVDVEWDIREAGLRFADQHGGNPLPEATIESIRRNGVALKGPLSTPIGGTFPSGNISLRRKLDLFAQVRRCRTLPGVRTPFADVDLVVIRETTEDLYSGVEFSRGGERTSELIEWLGGAGYTDIAPGSAISIKHTSEDAVRRVFRFAFEYTQALARTRVTCVHKATVMKATDGLFLAVAREVAADFPSIDFDQIAVDALAAQLVRQPHEYSVLVMPNLYGDIVSDLGAGLAGGVGLVPGGNFGDQTAIFEAGHGSAPKHAGKNRVNPIGMILSAAMMLRHLRERQAADRLEAAVAAVTAEGNTLTYDLKPRTEWGTAAGTSEVADAVIDHIRSESATGSLSGRAPVRSE
jgi:isocitrate dehydrogenase (NAD+)